MNIIFAKHDGNDKEFVFEVPDGMLIFKNDILWVETSRGETVAVATSDMITGVGLEQVAAKFGAYFPLKKVKTYANQGLKEYIEQKCIKEIKESVSKKSKSYIEEIEELIDKRNEILPF